MEDLVRILGAERTVLPARRHERLILRFTTWRVGSGRPELMVSWDPDDTAEPRTEGLEHEAKLVNRLSYVAAQSKPVARARGKVLDEAPILPVTDVDIAYGP